MRLKFPFSRRQRRWLAGLLVPAVAAVIVASAAPATLGQSAPDTEIRGTWLTNVDSDVLFSSQALRKGLNRLSATNFNTIYPTVWQGGRTLYRSEVAERTFGLALDPELDGRDALRDAIQQGHQKGMAVIPWFEFGFMAPPNSRLAQQHPDWLTQRRDGTKVEGSGDRARVWLNPFHPQLQQFILDLVTEVVANYDIDGIQLDDHFSLPVEFGYDERTARAYRRDTGKLPPADPHRQQWVSWRADRITEFVGRLVDEVKRIDPDCIVSVSPAPQEFARSKHLQDWSRWRERGYIDELVLQLYRSDVSRFRSELGSEPLQQAKADIPVAIGIISGLKQDTTPLPKLQAQASAARQEGFDGISFFFYESLWVWGNAPELSRMRALHQLFPQPAQRPSLPAS
ncbi:MAG: hypothetical protein BRC58_05850 [Cyanobacteria bacterium QS_8_64_29]|nr:MAG: hypothetical protein BRC58_05850 [Cyanobacteria bacterium QS_8_64_29]